jgi:hypothetical protein
MKRAPSHRRPVAISREAGPGVYYRRVGKTPGNRDTPDYCIQVTDRILGTLYCSVQEAFTPEEMDSRWKLIPVDEYEIPAKLRVALRALVNEVTEED